MAGYLRQKVKKITSSKYSSELHENRKPIPGTAISNTADSIVDRDRFLQNPAILDTLDTVHRSLLFNNLKFDTDEHAGLDGSSITGYSTLSDNQSKGLKERSFETSAVNARVPIHDKVNIAEASTDISSSGKEVVSQEDLHLERCGVASPSNEYGSLDDELEALFSKDWNNNLSGEEGITCTSKVKMMVQQFEQKKGKVSRPVRTSPPTVGGDTVELCMELAHPEMSSVGDAETSDFESASVTSGSSVCGDGGRRSVRTSSAFSEGSRDIASIDRFDLAMPTSHQQQQQEDLAGHNTMITININYRCDTNPLRTSKATCAEKEVGGKMVDIMVSSPPPAVTENHRKSLKGDKAIRQHTAERHVLAAAEDVADELMDLEQEQLMTDELISNESEKKINEVLLEDAGSESTADCMPKEHRGPLTNNWSCRTPDEEEYHDCDDLHESTLSFYEQACSQPVTPQEQKKRSSIVHASRVECSDELDGEQPMIQIVQELSEDHSEVTSTITLSKAQIRDMQKSNGARRSADSAEELKRHSPHDEKSADEKREKRRKSHSNITTKKCHDKSNLQRQQRIMDDNFCNEILDSTIHFDRLYGNNRPTRPMMTKEENVSSPSPTRRTAEECFSDSVVCEITSPGEESFDSVMSVGKLEGKPRYSGKTVGRLMMKRLKKLQGVGAHRMLDTSDASTSSSQQMSGPKKPPRTFANSPKRSTAHPAPSCPTAKDVEGSDPYGREIGWKRDQTKARTHQVGWTVPPNTGKNEAIPAQIYSMLNYSEDEGRKQLIKTGNSKPAPQQSTSSKGKTMYRPDGEPLGPKLEIDTVDGTRTPSRRHSTSTDFERFVRESNVKSTPHRKSAVTSRIETRRRIEEFLTEERHHAPVAQRKLPGVDRRRRTTGGIFEQRRQQQENFLDDARRTNHEPRRKPISKGQGSVEVPKKACCPASAAATTGTTSRTNASACGGGKVEKRRTFRKAALLKRTRTLFEASKKKIWAIKRFETPKKQNVVSNSSPSSNPSDRDPNINRHSSVKKKNNLHHKHLGYTPVHLRCKTCGSGQADGDREEEVVPINYCATRQQPTSHAGLTSSKDGNKENQRAANVDDRRRKSGEEVNRKSARSLNFATVEQGQRLNNSPVEHSDNEASPRKTGKQPSEIKFLKTLRNLKISPKRIFRFASQSSTALDSRSTDNESHPQGEFQSYDDLNLDNVANMGDFLSNIRRKIAEDEVDSPVIGRQSLQQAKVGRSLVPVDVHGEHEEPIYQEISPKGNKMVLNEFISSDTNKRYLMVNNNPNILYAMVEGKSARSSGRLVRARSLTNMHASVSVADPTVTSTPVSKPQNNTSKSHTKPNNRRVTMSPHMEARAVDMIDIEERENSLYNTALSNNLYTPRHRTTSDVANGRGSRGRSNRSFNATESTTGSSIRRSLFTGNTSSDHNRTLPQQHQHSTDDSDISILQEEESREDESSLESLPEETSIIEEPLIVRERVEDRLAFRKENEHLQQNPPATTSAIGSKGRYKGELEDLFSFEKDIIVEENMGGKNVKAGIASGTGVGQNLIVLKAHKSVQVKVNGNGAAPLGCFDTDGEIDSLRKYDDREIEELVHSLHDNITLSDIGTLDSETIASSSMGNELDNIGYDTVDLAPPVSRAFCQPAGKNLTIDTVDVSELISHAPDDSLSTGNLSPITSSPSSAKMSTSGTAVMRNLKEKLRSSFRKSRTFIKHERQRIANYLLEDRSSSKSPSSTTSSPRRHTMRETHANTIGHKQGGRTSDRRKQESDIESDDMYQSFTQGSNSIVTGSSMTELSTQHMNELMQQIIRQSDARKQLKQAVAICRSTREFECSPELIEAERLLLVATQKETAVRNELNKIDYLTNGMTLAEGKRVGTVTLNNFDFPLKETAVRDAMFNYFYVVVCTYKHEVKATIAKERHTDGRVYFRDCPIQFKNLDANYEIKVEVFVLQLRKNVKNYSFESRYHLEKDTKKPLSCPSPSKKLREAGRMLSFRSNSPKTFDFDNEFSRFKSQGYLTLTSFVLLTANGIEGEDTSGEEKTFDATYATACTNQTTQMSTMLETGDEVLLAAGNSRYSTSGHFQPVICRQDDQGVVFIAEDFKYLTLDSMAYTSNMVGTIGMSVRSEVRFNGSDISGFLDVGEKVDGNEGITWSRRWCQMNGFMLEFWNYPQECQEKQPILYIDLVKCINERIELADRSICSRSRTVRVEIFSSRVAAAGASCNSSGIGSFRSSGRPTSPSSVGEPASCNADRGHLRPISPGDGGRTLNNVTCYLLAADTQGDLKGWLNELNRVVKFLKEWKI